MKPTQVTIIFAIIMIQTGLDALSDPSQSPSPAASPNELRPTRPSQEPASVRRQMSCYVCSTMDYENPQDNSCKSFPKPARPMHQQPGGASHHPSSMSFAHHQQQQQQPSSPSPSPTDPAPMAAALDGGGWPEQRAPTAATSDGPAQYDDQVAADELNATTEAAPSSLVQRSSSGALAGPGSAFFPHHRLAQNALIRKRPCLEDENFCSIVSVVRIEFVNDTLVQRFWAMERNCSRSCNTGCMLIGERVRLRVCSQCCRSPDCNNGSGANSVRQPAAPAHFGKNLIVALISSAIMLRLSSQARTSSV